MPSTGVTLLPSGATPPLTEEEDHIGLLASSEVRRLSLHWGRRPSRRGGRADVPQRSTFPMRTDHGGNVGPSPSCQGSTAATQVVSKLAFELSFAASTEVTLGTNVEPP